MQSDCGRLAIGSSKTQAASSMTKKQKIMVLQHVASSIEKYTLLKPVMAAVTLPIGDVLRGYLCEDTSTKHAFKLHVFVQPLYVPFEHISLSFGREIQSPDGGYWHGDAAGIQEDVLIAIKESGTLAFVESCRTAAGLARTLDDTVELPVKQMPRYLEELGYSYARSEQFDRATLTLKALIHSPYFAARYDFEVEMIARAERMLEHIARQDPIAVHAQLDEWRRYTCTHLGIEVP